MANPLDIDLTGRVVLIRTSELEPEYHEDAKRAFRVTGGFGASPKASGRALFGVWLADNEPSRLDSYQVDCLAGEFEGKDKS